jgi:excisionase family DNA binding protein
MSAVGEVLVLVKLPDGSCAAFGMEALAEARARAASMGFGKEQGVAGVSAATEERWLDSRQLAALTGIGDTTLEGLARTGTIPSLRAGKALRFKLSEVEKALRARRDS